MPALTAPRNLLFVLFAVGLSGCSKQQGVSTPATPSDGGGASRRVGAERSPAGAPVDASQGDVAPSEELALDFDDGAVAGRRRPGLGTEFGEQKLSSIVTRRFVRGHTQPDVVLSLFYDDFEGVREMGRRQGGVSNASSRVTTPDGMLALTLVDERGQVIPAARVGAKRFAVGDVGQRYRIGIENDTTERFEVVASVDGLDVMDGAEAGYDKRGYIVEPSSSVMIEGWRTSHETVAAFRFSSMDDSYADRTGRPRNIGVIGVAFFHEEGGVPWDELHRRNSADPFPNRFTPPPPPPRVSL